MKTPPILVAIDSCFARAPMRRNNEAMINTIVYVNNIKIKNAPGSRFNPDMK